MHSTYLVIDQGGHGTRALVFNAQGDVVISAHAPIITTNPHTGWYEQSAQNLTSSLQQCLHQLSTALAARDILLSSAALITQRSSLIACYRDSWQAITPVIGWQDTRNSNWLQQGMDDGRFDITQLKQRTGLRLNAHYGASKMRWLLDHDPNVQAAARQNNVIFLPLACFVTHLLTNSQEAIVDAASASRTFLCEFGQQQWSDYLLSLFSLQKNCLPKIVGSKHAFGNIMLNGQAIPLQVVGGDQSFLPFAYGSEVLANALFVNAGTGAFVQTSLSLAATPASLLCSLAAVDHQQALTVAEGTVNACASALDWLFQQQQESLSHDEIEEAQKNIASPPIFYHRITALGSPYWLPAGESFFSEPASLPEKTVAVIESIIFLLAANIALLQQAKPKLQKILISGGISKSDGFCQKLANGTKLTVIRCANHEASSRGAAFYLASITSYAPLHSASLFFAMEDQALHSRYQSWRQLMYNRGHKINEENNT